MSQGSLTRPLTFKEYRQQVRRWSGARYTLHWCAHHLTNWYSPLASISMLIAVIFYFADTGNRTMQRHYQAWQVINTAQGKGGNGGRIEALEQLVKDKVSLTGVDVSGGFLQHINLDHAVLVRANFHNADVRSGSLQAANLSNADLSGANLRKGDLQRAELEQADLNEADLNGANLRNADLNGVNLAGADLRNADLNGAKWEQLASVKGTSISGVRNAPAGFLEWAVKNGAVPGKE
jgi:uncharacterized protein YjbI with pentapeptide repeats